MNRRFTKVAFLAATAMTLSLATPVGAQAQSQESGSAALAPQATNNSAAQSSLRTSSAVPAAAGPVSVTAVRLARGYSWDHRITRDANVSTRIAVDGSVAAGYSVNNFTADLFINNRQIGPITFSPYASSVSWHKRLGYGTAQLRNLRASVYSSAGGNQNVAVGTASNQFRIRRDFDSNLQMKYTKRGSKLTLRASKWRVHQPNGKFASVKKVKLQRLKGGKWRNIKNVRVNKSGNGKITFKSKKKYKYRLYYKSTKTIQGARTYASGKI